MAERAPRCFCGRALRGSCLRTGMLPFLDAPRVTVPVPAPRREIHARPYWRRNKKLSRATLARLVRLDRGLEPDTLDLFERPRSRGDCEGGPRPCPWVSCRYHLFLEVWRDGTLKLNYPELESPADMTGPSCVLDVVDQHDEGMLLEDVGDLLHISREQTRVIEGKALARVEAATTENGIGADWLGPVPLKTKS